MCRNRSQKIVGLPDNLNRTVIYQTVLSYVTEATHYKTFVSHIQVFERQVEFYSEQDIPLLNVDVDTDVSLFCSGYLMYNAVSNLD